MCKLKKPAKTYQVEAFKHFLRLPFFLRHATALQILAVKPIKQRLYLIDTIAFETSDTLAMSIETTVNFHQGITFAIAERQHFAWRIFWQKCSDN